MYSSYPQSIKTSSDPVGKNNLADGVPLEVPTTDVKQGNVQGFLADDSPTNSSKNALADGFADEQQPVSTSLFRRRKYSKNLADTQSTRFKLYNDYKIDVKLPVGT